MTYLISPSLTALSAPQRHHYLLAKLSLLGLLLWMLLSSLPAQAAAAVIGQANLPVLKGGVVYAIAKQSDGKIIIGGNFSHISGVARSHLARLNSDGSLDTGWTVSADDDVLALAVDASDNLYVGGKFLNVSSVSHVRLAKINSAGTVDGTWAPAPDNQVQALAVGTGGTDIYVGGTFSNIGGAGRVGLAKISASGTGLADGVFTTVTDNAVNALLFDGSNLYVGGSFTTIGGNSIPGFAQVSPTGTVTTAGNFNYGVSGTVNALARDSSGNIYIGGSISAVLGNSATNLARITAGSMDGVWLPSPNNTVDALAMDSSDNLYVGGNAISTIHGTAVSNVARILSASSTGTPDAGFSAAAAAGSGSAVKALLADTSGVFVGGDFNSFNGAKTLAGFAKTDGSGTVLPAWGFAQRVAVVYAVAHSSSGTTFVGGDFTFVGTSQRSNLARFGSGGSLDAWAPNPDGAVRALAVDDSGGFLYIGGDFSNVGANARAHLAKIVISSATADATWLPDPDNAVYALAYNSSINILYVGGLFNNIGAMAVGKLAKVSGAGVGTPNASYYPNPTGAVTALLLDGLGNLYAGGSFSSIGGQSRSNLAKLTAAASGTADATWAPDPDNQVSALATDGAGSLFVGGKFATIGGQNMAHLAKLSTSGTGTADATWGAGANNDVNALVYAASYVYAGGAFHSAIGGQTRIKLTKLDSSSGTADSAWSFDGDDYVLALAIDSSGNLYVGGQFTSLGGVARVGFGEISSVTGSPSQPLNPVAVAGTGQATITFSTPSSDGGSPITGYTVVASPAGGADADAGSTALTHTVTGLSGGTSYTFTVTASNALGSGAASNASNAVTIGGPPVLPSSNANLASLSLSSGSLSPGFSPLITDYTALVPNSISSVSVSYATQDEKATVTGASNVTLAVGDTPISLQVTAQNGTSKTYSIVITRAPVSSNANLATLTLSNGNLSPSFAAAITSYSATVGNATKSITLTPTVVDSKTKVSINGNLLASGGATVSLAIGSNTFSIVTTAEDGTTSKTYTLNVARLAGDNASLSSIALSSGSLAPTFNSGILSYKVNVSNATASLTISPQAEDADASITMNGTPLAKGAGSAINLNIGLNTIAIQVKAIDGATSKTYTLAVTRAGSSNADLSALALSAGTLTPAFTPGNTIYNVTMPDGVSSLSLTPTPAEGNATMLVNDVAVAKGSASQPIALNLGLTFVTVVVTAQDGTTSKVYNLAVSRPDLKLSLSGTGSFDFGSAIAGNGVGTQLTLSNTGRDDVAILGITLAPPFVANSDCPALLKTGSSCTLSLFFMPLSIDATRAGRNWSSALAINTLATVKGLPFTVTGIAKTKPLPSSFSSVSGVDQGVLVLSNEIDPLIGSASAVSVSNGQYAINDGPFTSAPGTLNPGDAVKVQHTSARDGGTDVTTTLSVGSKSLGFTSTTSGKPFALTDGTVPSQSLTVSTESQNLGGKTFSTVNVDVDLSSFFGASQQRFAADNGYQVFLVGYVPAGAAGQVVPVLFFKNTLRIWVGVSSPLAAYLENVALNASSKVTINVLSDFDLGLLSGTEFYIGVGTSDLEMLSAKRYRAFYRVP